MTTIASRASDAATSARTPSRTLGLSSRLILLTMSFVMLAQIIVYLPSVASFRRAWVGDRVSMARMIAIALSTAPSQTRSAELESKLVEAIKGAQGIAVRGIGTRWLVVTSGEEPPAVRREIDLRDSPWWRPLRGLARNALGDISPATRIIGPGVPGVEWVELVVDEAPLWHATVDYTRNFVGVSLIISLFTGALLYLALHLMVVRPVRRLTTNITAFAGDPENATRIISTTGRTDEIGLAEQSLARMETALAAELRKKRRLADLGLAVSKINHELRNMLTTAQLLGDRLREAEDPSVKRIAPRLITTLDRAIEYCSTTLAYSRATERPPRRRIVPLKPIVIDQLDLTKLGDGHPISVELDIADDLAVDADPEQLGRVLLNVMRNSVEALARAKTENARIALAASRLDGVLRLRVSDNGPGVPDRAKARLFSAFQASERSGGTGLGLPIAEELVRLHGGSIVLEEGGPGASFLVTIPDRQAGLE